MAQVHRFTTVTWLICIIASIGFAFDIYELLMLPLVIKPAMAALGGLSPGSPEYSRWARALFFLPALVGGLCGLVGGYLTDHLGRRRVLTWSILLYAGAALASGFSRNLYELLFFRCLVFIGVCVEFVAAVAWLAELFENRDQRERVLGYTQAFSSVGGLMVGVANVVIANIALYLPAIHGGHEAWRYTLISGVVPAIPLIVIRPFLPESPKWQEKRDAGLLRRPSLAELFSPQLARATVVTTICFAASYGMAFGAIQQLTQILSGHVEVRAEAQRAVDAAIANSSTGGTQGVAEVDERALTIIRRNASDEAVAKVQIWQEVGGLVGRFLLAMLAVAVVSRRRLLRIFQLPALFFVPLLFYWISQNLSTENSLALIKAGAFMAGVVIVGQFSFWGNYIPHVFPLHLRGTGESFAANIGGRILGTAAAWLTLTFSASAPGEPPNPGRIALVAAIVAGSYCLVGALLTFWLPEPRDDRLPD